MVHGPAYWGHGGKARDDCTRAYVRMLPKLAVSDLMGIAEGKGTLVWSSSFPRACEVAALDSRAKADSPQSRLKQALTSILMVILERKSFVPACQGA